MRAPFSLPSLHVEGEGYKEELPRKAAMVAGRSESWAFQVDWSGEMGKSEEAGEGDFPKSIHCAIALLWDLQQPWENQLRSLLTNPLSLGSVPKQISLAADSRF